MFIRVTPTFAATSTNEGNSSLATTSNDVPRSSHTGTEAQRKLRTLSVFLCASVVNFSSSDLCLNLNHQPPALRIIFIEHQCALCRVERIGQFSAPEIGGAQAEPAWGVKWTCRNSAS